MTSTKLPAYFERYLDQRFGEVREQIAELKLHVNDELQDLKEMAHTNQKNIQRLFVISAALAFLLIVHDLYGGDIIGLIKSIFI